MPGTSPYSLDRAKRSLIHFGVGKGASAAFGLCVLVLSIRLLPARDYGIYVTLIAMLEMYYVITGFGLSTVAQRYVAEFRVKSSSMQFRRFILRIVRLRLAIALLSAMVVFAVSSSLMSLLALHVGATTQWLFVALLVVGSGTRYLDEVFPALLLHGYTQSLALMANVVKMLALAIALLNDWQFGYAEMIGLEFGVAVLLALTGAFLLWRYLCRIPLTAIDSPEHENARMWPVAWRFYLVQLLGQIYGPNAVKLLLTKILGPTQTAAFGFLQSLADMIRNYLPAYLLATWVRPLMVARYIERRDVGELSITANLVFKLSVMTVAPFGAYFVVCGDAFAAWISSGKYGEASAVLTTLMLLIALQSLHVVMSMVTATVERAGASVIATTASCVALPLIVAMTHYWGLTGVAAAMSLGECLWIYLVWVLLARDGLRVSFDLLGTTKIIVAGLLATAVLSGIESLVEAGWALLLPLALAGIVVLSSTAVLKPFTPAERAVVARLIPARYILW